MITFYICKSRALLPVLLLLGISGCLTHVEFDENEYKTAAWNSLTQQERASVIHDPAQAAVNPHDEYRDWSGGESPGIIAAVSVRFNTIHDPLLGPIVVYLDRETLAVLGQAPRD